MLRRHLWPHTGVEVRAGFSRFRCSVPDMLQNCDGENGSDFVGVFLGEFEIFSKKEEQVLSHKGDGSPLSLLLLLPMDDWVGLDELIGVRGVTLLRPNGAQLLSRPEMAFGVLTV